jgi:hypothetical protein
MNFPKTMTTGLAIIAVSVGLFDPSQILLAQDLTSFLKASFDSRANGETNPLHFRIQPVAIPNAFSPSAMPTELQFMLNRMDVDGDVASFDQGKAILQLLSNYSASVVVGERKLTPTESSNLKAAEKLLRDNNSNPTPEYSKYRGYEKKDAELRTKLASSTSNEAIATLRMEIDENDEQWQLFGKKGEIRAALAIVLSYSNQDALDLRSNWQGLIQDGEVLDTSAYYGSLASQLGATRIRIERTPAIANLAVKCVPPMAAGNKLFTLSRVEFDAIRIPITNKLLTHRFLGSDLWKHREGELIADGQGGGTLPYIPQELVVAYGLQIEFAENAQWAKFATVVSESSDVLLDGFVVKSAGNTQVTAFPMHLRWNSPQIIGVIATKLKKTPSPASNVTWEN